MAMMAKGKYPQTNKVVESLLFSHLSHNHPNSLVNQVGRMSLLYRSSLLHPESFPMEFSSLLWSNFTRLNALDRYTLMKDKFREWLMLMYADTFRDYVLVYSQHDMVRIVKGIEQLYEGVEPENLGDVFNDFVYCALAYNGYAFNHQGVIPASPKLISQAFEHLPVPYYGARLCDPYAGTGSMIYELARHGKIFPSQEVALAEHDHDGMVLSALRLMMGGSYPRPHDIQETNFTFDWKDVQSVSLQWRRQMNWVASFPPMRTDEYYTTGDFREPVHPWIKAVFGEGRRTIKTWITVLLTQINLLDYGGYGLIILGHGALGINAANGTYQKAREHLFSRCDVQMVVELDPMEAQPFYKSGYNMAALIYQKNDDGQQNGVTFIDQKGQRIYRTPDELEEGYTLWPRTYTKVLDKVKR